MKDPNTILENEILIELAKVSAPGEIRQIIDKDLAPPVSEVSKDDYFKRIDTFLKIAAGASCSFCGKLPCGNDSTMALLTIRDGGKILLLEGVCNNCKTTLIGQSPLRIHYRALVASNSGIVKRVLVIQNGKVMAFGG